MLITLNWLKEHNACSDGVKYFKKNCPSGEADCQAILDHLKINDPDNYAYWLIRQSGYYGERNEQVNAKLQQISNIKWFKPQQENRVKVAALVQEHLKRLHRFGSVDSAAVVFTNDLDAARAAARDAARDAAYTSVADLLDWPSPWEPLLEIYELGYWPVCLQNNGKFLVYEPKIR